MNLSKWSEVSIYVCSQDRLWRLVGVRGGKQVAMISDLGGQITAQIVSTSKLGSEK